MQMSNVVEGTTLTAFVEGNLDTSTADEFYGLVEAGISDLICDVVVDLKEVEFVSSKGLRALVKLYKQVGDGHFRVQNANDAVTRVINLSGLSERFGLEL